MPQMLLTYLPPILPLLLYSQYRILLGPFIMPVLSKAELKFMEDLKAWRAGEYEPTYRRTLKHRILKTHKQLTHEALLINEVLEKLEAL